MSAKDGFSPARLSAVVPGRMCSSRSRTTSPLRSTTGTTDRLKRPSFQATAARSWDSAAYSSTSRREKPSMVAIRSAPIPCGTKPVSWLVRGSSAQAPPSLPIGTRDMDSTPPARTRSSHPERTFMAAMLTASRPEAQKRFSCTPATVSGNPAAIAAMRAMSEPWSPTGPTTPSTMSSTAAGSRPGNRARISWMRPTTRSTGFVPCRAPFALPRPRGVRIASYTYASVLTSGVLPVGVWRPASRRGQRWGRSAAQPRRERPMISFMISVVPP
ncbi:hypothetical protein B0E38_07345 [Streptomyces sp. 111WW2]|nr:hypothetical protein B0E38_07345 [Streptomyces sp. 111WW2]